MTQRLLSIGRLAERIGRPCAMVERTIAALSIQPSLELNGLRYFDEAAERAVDDELRQGARAAAMR